MTEIEKKILEFYTKETYQCKLEYFYLKHANFSMDVEITFNNKTEYFSKEKLMYLVKDAECGFTPKLDFRVFWDTWAEEVHHQLIQNTLMSHFKKLERMQSQYKAFLNNKEGNKEQNNE